MIANTKLGGARPCQLMAIYAGDHANPYNTGPGKLLSVGNYMILQAHSNQWSSMNFGTDKDEKFDRHSTARKVSISKSVQTWALSSVQAVFKLGNGLSTCI